MISGAPSLQNYEQKMRYTGQVTSPMEEHLGRLLSDPSHTFI